jgi:hypothetical protein
MGKFSEPNFNKPQIEQVSEFRNTTRRGSEPAPPRASEFAKGARTVAEIHEAAEARREQSKSWANRDSK